MLSKWPSLRYADAGVLTTLMKSLLQRLRHHSKPAKSGTALCDECLQNNLGICLNLIQNVHTLPHPVNRGNDVPFLEWGNQTKAANLSDLFCTQKCYVSAFTAAIPELPLIRLYVPLCAPPCSSTCRQTHDTRKSLMISSGARADAKLRQRSRQMRSCKRKRTQRACERGKELTQ